MRKRNDGSRENVVVVGRGVPVNTCNVANVQKGRDRSRENVVVTYETYEKGEMGPERV